MRRITIPEFHAELRAQGVSNHEHFAFVCPMCKTVQSGHDLIEAGAGRTFEDIEKFLAFSCVGRFTDAESPREAPDGEPCDWTLGGLFQCHDLEVVDEDGVIHPRFAPASPEQAQAHERKHPERLPA